MVECLVILMQKTEGGVGLKRWWAVLFAFFMVFTGFFTLNASAESAASKIDLYCLET